MIPRFYAEEITFPIVQLYMQCENRLLRSIIKQAKRGADLTGEKLSWDISKLNDLGGLTKGAITEIAKTSRKAQKELGKVLLEVAKEAVKRDGIKGEPSQGVFKVVQALQAQASNDLNVVNTVMLSGVQNVYGDFVACLMNERNKALGSATVELVTGTSTFQKSVAHAVREMSRKGITAHVDKLGREWSPEGYVSMDLRTTSAKVARKAVEAEANDFGLHVFQVSSHAGARPKCAPYQGRFFSDDGTSGEIEDAYGNRYEYEPLERTSYGEPDGLFGINCGHDRIYVSEGFYNRRKPLTEEELEADREIYRQSQQQRAIERDIRLHQREADNLKEAGLTEFGRIAQKYADDCRAEYRAFCSETGRAERWDRTKVY